VPRCAALIVSSEFWPTLTSIARPANGTGSGSSLADDDDGDGGGLDFKLPPVLAGLFECYASEYHVLKTPRVVDWRAGMECIGCEVELELSMGDGRVETVKCQPIHAAIIERFAQHARDDEDGDGMTDMTADGSRSTPATRTRLSLVELCESLHMDDEDVLRQKCQFWVQRGILREMRDRQSMADKSHSMRSHKQTQSSYPICYELIEYRTGGSGSGIGVGDDDDEGDDDDDGGNGSHAGAYALSSDLDSDMARQGGEQQKLLETYILGALNNFSLLSVSRLHNTLKLFNVPGFLYTATEAELKLILNQLTRRGVLMAKDGGYMRAKKLNATEQ